MGFFSNLTNDTLEDIPCAYTNDHLLGHEYLYLYLFNGQQLIADLYDGYGRYRLNNGDIVTIHELPDYEYIQFSYSPNYIYRPGEKSINSPSQGFFGYSTKDMNSSDIITRIFNPDFKRSDYLV